jgi:hypothetical protein
VMMRWFRDDGIFCNEWMDEQDLVWSDYTSSAIYF